MPAVDYVKLFAALPTPHFVVTANEYVIVDANTAYLNLFGLAREDIVGRPMLEVFPPSEETLDEHGVPVVLQSFVRARDTGRPDSMPVERYDIADPITGEPVTRFWSHIVVPVLGEDGRAELLVQRLDEVTDYVRALDREEPPEELAGTPSGRSRNELEAAVFTRGRELQLAREAEAQAADALTALTEVGRQIAQAADVKELSTVFTGAGLALLGASVGSVAVTDGDFVRIMISPEYRGRLAEYAELPADSPLCGPAVAASGVAVLLPDRQACADYAPGMEDVLAASGVQAIVSFPLGHQERLLGSLSFGWDQPRVFTLRDQDVFASLAAQTAQTLARIQTAEADRARAAEGTTLAEVLQRSLLTEPAQTKDLLVVVRYRAASSLAQIGGDWYDSFITHDGTFSVVIGDVAGHDGRAAAIMGQLRNMLRGIAYVVREPPGRLLTLLDRAMRDMGVDALATAALATVTRPDAAHPISHTFQWSNAGHPPPLLLNRDGSARLLTAEPDLLLGLNPDTSRHDHTQVLSPGDTVLLYTDGLVERRGADLDEGMNGLLLATEQLAHLPPGALCDALLSQVADSVEDDICLLALHVLADR